MCCYATADDAVYETKAIDGWKKVGKGWKCDSWGIDWNLFIVCQVLNMNFKKYSTNSWLFWL